MQGPAHEGPARTPGSQEGLRGKVTESQSLPGTRRCPSLPLCGTEQAASNCLLVRSQFPEHEDIQRKARPRPLGAAVASTR